MATNQNNRLILLISVFEVRMLYRKMPDPVMCRHSFLNLDTCKSCTLIGYKDGCKD